jgi:hypothetical protein
MDTSKDNLTWYLVYQQHMKQFTLKPKRDGVEKPDGIVTEQSFGGPGSSYRTALEQAARFVLTLLAEYHVPNNVREELEKFVMVHCLNNEILLLDIFEPRSRSNETPHWKFGYREPNDLPASSLGLGR